jgi:hypothetical protein
LAFFIEDYLKTYRAALALSDILEVSEVALIAWSMRAATGRLSGEPLISVHVLVGLSLTGGLAFSRRRYDDRRPDSISRGASLRLSCSFEVPLMGGFEESWRSPRVDADPEIARWD